MAVITADATKMVNDAEEMIKLINESSVLLDELYERLYTINTKCWKSSKADSYVVNLKNDKKQYDMVINNLMSYANYLKNAGVKLENIIGKIN